MKKHEPVLCQCGCGEKFVPYRITQKYKDERHSHRVHNKKARLMTVSPFKYNGYVRKYRQNKKNLDKHYNPVG